MQGSVSILSGTVIEVADDLADFVLRLPRVGSRVDDVVHALQIARPAPDDAPHYRDIRDA